MVRHIGGDLSGDARRYAEIQRFNKPGESPRSRQTETADGCPHDPALGRRRAETYALPLFRERLLGYIDSVTSGRRDGGEHVPPAPHLRR